MLFTTPNIKDSISKFDLFKILNEKELDLVLTFAEMKSLKHREFIYRTGDPAETFCIVFSGALKLFKHSPRGEDIIMHFAVQGDPVGALVMNHACGATFPVSVKAMGPTKVICVPRSTFLEHWQNNAKLMSQLNQVLYRRMSNIQDDKMMSTSPLKVRIANLLLRHLDQDSRVESQTMSLVLTRQEIADALGVAVESVIRAMSIWQDDGTISKIAERGPEIINVEKLIKNIEC